MYIDRILPSVAEKRAELEAVIKPRVRQAMEADSFTDEQITRYKAANRERSRYHHAKTVLGNPSLRALYPLFRLNAMQAFVTDIEGNAQRMQALIRLGRLGARIDRFQKMKDYLERGVGGMDDTRLGQYLAMKQAQSYRQHDPVEAFPEEKVGPDCPHPRQYLVLFDGLELEEARGYCLPAEGDPKTALRRRHRFRFALLPQTARDAIEADVVPRVTWDPAYMELKGG
jgi:hypothetical protein